MDLAKLQYYLQMSDADILQRFRTAVEGLGNNARLMVVKERYNKLEGPKRGDREAIVKVLMLDSNLQESIELQTYFIIRRLVPALDAALDSTDANHAQWKELYTTLCKKLDIHYTHVIPFLSSDPEDNETVTGELNDLGFVALY